eukprot:gene49572-66403_t
MDDNPDVKENQSKLSSQDQTHLDQAAIKRRLMRPCQAGDPPIRCFIEREKGGMVDIHPTLRLYTEGSSDQKPRFVMAAKKRTQSRTSYFLISSEMDPNDRASESVVGKVRGNAVGSQYMIYDGGLGPDKTISPSSLRKSNPLPSLNSFSCFSFPLYSNLLSSFPA